MTDEVEKTWEIRLKDHNETSVFVEGFLTDWSSEFVTILGADKSVRFKAELGNVLYVAEKVESPYVPEAIDDAAVAAGTIGVSPRAFPPRWVSPTPTVKLGWRD